MREFNIFNSKGKKIKLIINDVQVTFGDCATVNAECQGMQVESMLCFGGGRKKPFIRFYKDKKPIDAILTNEIIEYIWNEIGCPYTGLLYGYTENYRANWED